MEYVHYFKFFTLLILLAAWLTENPSARPCVITTVHNPQRGSGRRSVLKPLSPLQMPCLRTACRRRWSLREPERSVSTEGYLADRPVLTLAPRIPASPRIGETNATSAVGGSGKCAVVLTHLLRLCHPRLVVVICLRRGWPAHRV